MKGIILHGGHGTRLRPLTHTGPKQLLPIANKPMSEYCLESIIETGIKDIAIIIGGVGSDKVKEYYGNGGKFGVNITYVEQDEPKGIAHAIRLCKEFINNEKFLVFLGDNIIQKSIVEFTERFKNSNFDSTILLCEVNNPSRFGIAEVKNNKILKIIEKPKNPPSNLAVTGIYLLTPKIFNIIDDLKPSWRNELEITKMDNSFEKKYDKNKNDGKLVIGENCEIDSDVVINGPVIIGNNCKIECGTVIGPNASIGDDTEISKCQIKNSIVMKKCKIHSNVKIIDSIIANNSEIFQKEKSDDGKIFLLGEGSKISF